MKQIAMAAPPSRPGTTGVKFWRSLGELQGSAAFDERLHREFPVGASELNDPAARRTFLKLMGASLALAGTSGACTRLPHETIVPYVRQPEEIVPGKPLFFATALEHAGSATPVLVESHMGRPTKIEPNPDHPATGGGTDIYALASVLTLYDPDRSQAVKHLGEISSWTEFEAALKSAIAAQVAVKGGGLRLLTEPVVSPTLTAQIEELMAALPEARWYQYDAIPNDHVRQGAKLAFGRYVDARYHLANADVIVALDADLLSAGPGRLRCARDFADRRRLTGGRTEMNRLYVAESTPTNTGASADHRIGLKASAIDALARALASGVGVEGVGAQPVPGAPEGWVAAVVDDLKQHAGRSLVVTGPQQPPAVQALVHAINAVLGNVGQTVDYAQPIESHPAEHLGALAMLAQEIAAGAVEILVIIGQSNPVFTAPVDLDLVPKLDKVGLRIHLGLFDDETAQYCHWHVPQSHALEAWSDARTFDGTVTICQPLIAPLYESKSAHELIAAMQPTPDGRTGYDIVRDFWKQAQGGAPADFEPFWRRAVHDGFVAGSAPQPVPVTAQAGAIPAATPAAEGLELTMSPDFCLYDGRFANNGWMMELPRPLSKITWDNVALVGPATAARLGVENEDVITLTWQGRSLDAPVYVQAGQPADTINVQFGFGRTKAGRVGDGVGFNPYALRTTGTPWFGGGLDVTRTGRRYPLAATQEHFAMEGREIVKAAGLEAYRQNPQLFDEPHEEPGPDMTLYFQEHPYRGYAWGMSIDLNACIGCNACMVACQAENNISVVGKVQTRSGREMHWIRIDRYFAGDAENPESYTQPVPCQQCENAPCEVVCPVAATSHSSEGLNDMVYNRCVGTRYCQNNCPYKVRRFNFYLYADWDTPSLKMQRNPDVTVRSRGVMEKCTYCVQRINHARIQSKLEDRRIRDGEIVTACEAACPAGAIVFGDIHDPESRVWKAKQEPRTYGLLAELGTRPRTTYLAAVRNPNPRLAPAGGRATTEH